MHETILIDDTAIYQYSYLVVTNIVENPRVSVWLIESPEVTIISIASSTRHSHFHCITKGICLIIGQSRKREEEAGCP